MLLLEDRASPRPLLLLLVVLLASLALLASLSLPGLPVLPPLNGLTPPPLNGISALPALGGLPALPPLNGLPISHGLPAVGGLAGSLPTVGGLAGGLPDVGGLTGGLPNVGDVTKNIPSVPSLPLSDIAGLPASLNSAFGNIFGAGFDLISAALSPGSIPSLPSVPGVEGLPSLSSPASLLTLASQLFDNFFQYLSAALNAPLSSVPRASSLPSTSSVPKLSLPKMRFMPRQQPGLSGLPIDLSRLPLSGLPLGGSLSLPGLSLGGNLLNPASLLSTVRGTLSGLPSLGGLLGSVSGIAGGLPIASPILSSILSGGLDLPILLSTLSGLTAAIPLPGSLSALTAGLPGLGFKEKRDLTDLLALGGGLNLAGILGFVPRVGPVVGNLVHGLQSTVAGLAGGVQPATQLLRNSPLNGLLDTVSGATSGANNGLPVCPSLDGAMRGDY